MDRSRHFSGAVKLGFLLVLVVFLLMLCACSAQQGGAEGDEPSGGSAAQSANAQTGSMQVVHTPEQLKMIDGDFSKKNCLSCHPRTTITAATKDYGDAEGYNPHAAHTESYDCTTCHSIESTSVLVCNTACHGGYHGEGNGWPLPQEGWQNPTDEVLSADGTSVQ